MNFLILAFLALSYAKTYLVTDAQAQASFSYLFSFGLPLSALIIVFSDIVYTRFLAKLQQSHTTVYNRLLATLVFVTISVVISLILFSIYLSDPEIL